MEVLLWNDDRVGEKKWYYFWSKEKKVKIKWKSSSDHNYANKENQDPQKIIKEEKKKNKVFRLQKSAESKISNWIKTGTKDSWFSFKNN